MESFLMTVRNSSSSAMAGSGWLRSAASTLSSRAMAWVVVVV